MTDEALIDRILRRELPPGVMRWDDPRNVARCHAADRGGWTRGGITARAWAQVHGLAAPASPEILNAITEAEARAFYVAWYVAPWRWCPDVIRAIVVDWHVTSGPGPVTRGLQRALRQQGLYDGPIDGIAGPRTRAAVTSPACDLRRLVRDVVIERIRHVLAIAYDAHVRAFLRAHPQTQLHFLHGWILRCLDDLPC